MDLNGKRILVVQLKQIGDVLLSTPVCNNIKIKYPRSNVDYVIYDYASGVVEGNPNIDNIIKITEKERSSKIAFIKFLWKLSKNKYDIVINIQGKLEGLLLTLFSGAKIKIGTDRKWWRLVNSFSINPYEVTKEKISPTTIFDRLSLLTPLGINSFDPNFKIWLDEAEKVRIKQLIWDSGLDLSRPIITFGVTSRRVVRVWQMEKYAEVINHLNDKYGAQSILFYAPNDKKYNSEEEYCKELEKKVKNKKDIFTNVKTKNIRELACLLGVSDMYIGNDNGPRHISQAVDTPTLSIFITPNSAFSPGIGERHRAFEIKDELGLSDKEYQKFLDDSKNIWEAGKALSTEFVVRQLDKMIKDLNLFTVVK